MAVCTHIQHVCSEALRMRSACHAISGWRVQKQVALFFLTSQTAFSFLLCNSRRMSSQDQEGTDPPTFTEAQQEWIERLIATKISEAAPTSTATTTSDSTVISGAPIGPILPATTAGHGGVGEYSVKMGEGVKGDKHNN